MSRGIRSKLSLGVTHNIGKVRTVLLSVVITICWV